jgi:hypothetical protein
MCVHPDHLCDGWAQCPQHDDEWLCGEGPCPDRCLCQGLAFVCDDFFLIHSYPKLRYLHVHDTTIDFESCELRYIVFLKAVRYF